MKSVAFEAFSVAAAAFFVGVFFVIFFGAFGAEDDVVEDLAATENAEDLGGEIGCSRAGMESAFHADALRTTVDDEIGELVVGMRHQIVMEALFVAVSVVVGVDNRSYSFALKGHSRIDSQIIQRRSVLP